MTVKPTRRGLLKGTLGGTLGAALSGCTRERLRTEHANQAVVQPPDSADTIIVDTEVNGKATQLATGPDTSAVETIREQLGLTGTKVVCGHGACGACTVQVDGVPMASCLLPATSLHNRKVTTVEGLARKPRGLHPVQRAFIGEDAMQCGFCTPGFVVEAAAFYDNWRREHGRAEPSREEIADALSGHLCRCGTYAQIFSAVQKACTGAYDNAGERGPRHDARDKVTGEATYTVDIQLPEMLYGAIARAQVAHATIRNIDWSRALELPGVHAAVDLTMGVRTIRYTGQELVAIAAVSEDIARRAVELVVFDLEVHTPIVGIDAGRAPEATPVYPTRATRKKLPNANEAPLLPLKWEGNLRGPFRVFSKLRGRARRAVDQAKQAGDATMFAHGRYETQVQCHTCLEPHACVADWRDDGLSVHLSTQAVHQSAEDIAKRFDLDPESVQLYAQHVGGGFGGKAILGLEMVAAVELSRATQRPVRVILDRHEELATGGNRPAQDIDFSLASDNEGKFTGIQAISHADAGVAVGSAPSLLFRIMYAKTPKHLEDWDVITHAAPGKPLRGPGGPPAFWALEQAVDELAHARGEDPITLRKRNDPNPVRKQLYSWAESLPLWTGREDRVAADRGRYRRGVGLAVGGWFYFVQPSARVQLDTTPGGFVVSTAAQDIGNGTRTILANAVADVFGVSPGMVAVRIGDSSLVPGPMSAGSRTATTLDPAARAAAQSIQEELLEIAETQLGFRGVQAIEGGIRHSGGETSWTEILARAPRLSTIGRRKRDRNGYFFSYGGLAAGRYISGSLQVSEVEVDTLLGTVRVVQSQVGLGVGKVFTPPLALSQATGGVIQGISFALYEERRLDPVTGALLTGNLEDYRIAGMGDVGKIDIHFMEKGFENVSAGGVGLAELVKLTPAAAIGNAVFHATGFRPKSLPLRPDRVLKGLRA